MEEVPRRTSLVPLAFPCFVLCFIGVEIEGLLDYQGRAGDHIHYIWCGGEKSVLVNPFLHFTKTTSISTKILGFKGSFLE